MTQVLAVDVGGTKLRVGLVHADGAVGRDAIAVTPPGASAEALWSALAGLVDHVLAEGDPSPVAVGVGCGGPMEPGGVTVSPLNIEGWRRFPLRARLSEHTGLPVSVDNDAKALALGEGWLGAAVGRSAFLAMVVSTGVGGGIVLDGGLLDGAGGNAGHIGHVVVEPAGRLCGCGARGCLEAEASGTAIAAITGRHPSLAPPALRARVGTLVGRAVGSVANLLDLDLALVGGSVALGYGSDLLEAARAELAAVARLDHSAGVELHQVGLGADGPLVGAAAVGWRAIGWQGVERPPPIG